VEENKALKGDNGRLIVQENKSRRTVFNDLKSSLVKGGVTKAQPGGVGSSNLLKTKKLSTDAQAVGRNSQGEEGKMGVLGISQKKTPEEGEKDETNQLRGGKPS